MSTTNETTLSGKIPASKKILWGAGGVADTMIMNGINGLVDQIYMIGMALDPKWVGLARSVPRFLDIMLDPVIGHLSDNTRSRWGRRRPWMLAGAVISAMVAILMWYPPARPRGNGGESVCDRHARAVVYGGLLALHHPLHGDGL